MVAVVAADVVAQDLAAEQTEPFSQWIKALY